MMFFKCFWFVTQLEADQGRGGAPAGAGARDTNCVLDAFELQSYKETRSPGGLCCCREERKQREQEEVRLNLTKEETKNFALSQIHNTRVGGVI